MDPDRPSRMQVQLLTEKFTDAEKRKLLGRVVEVAVRTTSNTHYYKWAGEICRQSRGGAIGLKATGVVAKVAMED